MSFETEALKSNNNKVILFQVDAGVEWGDYVTIAAGVYAVSLSNTYAKLVTFTTFPAITEYTEVGSVVCSGIQMVKKSSLADVILYNNSFFYDRFNNKMLYLHCPEGDDPRLFILRLGIIYGFRKGGEQVSYNDLPYPNKIIDLPNLSINKDPLFWGSFNYDNATIKLDNSDGEFDGFIIDNYVQGSKARLFAGYDGWGIETFDQIFDGIIGNAETNEKDFSLTLTDYRLALTTPVPDRYFTTAVYPNLDESDIGAPIPRAFGPLRHIPIYVVDKAQTTGAGCSTYVCKICDTYYTSAISAVSAIYADGENITSSTNVKNLNLGTRTFKIVNQGTTADVNPASASITATIVGEVTSTGGVIQNGAKAIRKLLKDYYEVDYTTDFYDIANWNESGSRNIGIYINETKDLIDHITDICADGVQANFYLSNTGKYKLKINNDTDTSVQTIYRYQIEGTPSKVDQIDQILTSIVVGYDRNWNDDDYKRYVNETQVDDIFIKFGIYNQKEFNTLCQNSTAAYDYSVKILEKSGNRYSIVKVRLPNWVALKRELGENIDIYLDRPYKKMLGKCKCEIIGINKNFDTYDQELTLRLISQIEE